MNHTCARPLPVFIACLVSILVSVPGFLGAEPLWWAAPRKDDAREMVQVAKASAKSETEAMDVAIRKAKELLAERIGIIPALRDAGIDPSPEFAIVDLQVFDKEVAESWGTWTCWVMVTYPVAEKNRLLARWKESIASFNDLKPSTSAIPVEFKLRLATLDGQTRYRDGDNITFVIESDKDCHVLLFDHMSDGTTVLLFPNAFHPDSFVRKGERVLVPPSSNQTFQLRVQEPYGDDKVELIASTSRSDLHVAFGAMLKGLDASNPVVAMPRGVFVQQMSGVKRSQGKQWSKASLSLSTFPR